MKSLYPHWREITSLTNVWRRRFAIMEENACPLMNWWGFFFGPFYLALLGLWRQALMIVLLAFAAVLAEIIVLGEINPPLWLNIIFAIALFCFVGIGVNIWYYRYKVLRRREWSLDIDLPFRDKE